VAGITHLFEASLGHDVERRLEQLRQGLLLLAHVFAIHTGRKRGRYLLDRLRFWNEGIEKVSVGSHDIHKAARLTNMCVSVHQLLYFDSVRLAHNIFVVIDTVWVLVRTLVTLCGATGAVLVLVATCFEKQLHRIFKHEPSHLKPVVSFHF